MNAIKKCFLLFCFFLSLVLVVAAQEGNRNKYPSLLWEITGNGLTKPSYLFGTMHVSNKMVFHLGDAFYDAIKSTDAVALELNPDLWQSQMVELDKLKENYAAFNSTAGNDFLTENSFRLNPYLDELKVALQSEPAMVNNLLYRSYKTKEDFEEDTFLDLYIFQTGKKLGKSSAGVENYYEAEKLVLEAYADMAREKKKKKFDLDGESLSEMLEKLQQAYRRGDLDLMDSLDNVLEQSEAFREKFLYKRNEIQANSIDSIIQTKSLFAGVGAAHLPGNRGVIEILRKKGYTLKPVKMADRNANQKTRIDNLRVPVHFQHQTSDDGLFSLEAPGKLYKTSQDYQQLDRRQYSDMSNGSYYMITRVKTHAAFLGQSADMVLKKTDSILYENVPGKILSKKSLTDKQHKGIDILSRTRRGDLQRYQVFITPNEIIIFKMSGKENYVEGPEADQFFSSIRFESIPNLPLDFEPATGGFRAKLPQMPLQYLDDGSGDARWQYEAVDSATGDAYLIMKKSVYNFSFTDEDSFDLGLMEISFSNPELFDKQISRRQFSWNGLPALDVKEKLKNGALVYARYLIQGPHHYLLAHRTNQESTDSTSFFDNFSLTGYRYQNPRAYSDTFLRATVQSAVVPQIDKDLRRLMEQLGDDASNGNNASGFISYWPKPKTGIFRNDSTGEMIQVKTQEFPRYYYIRDSAKYWQNEVNGFLSKNDMYVSGEIKNISGKDFTGVRFVIRDTGSSRTITHQLMVKNGFQYTLSTIGDTMSLPGTFIRTFYDSFHPDLPSDDRDVYQNRVPLFFNDLLGADSATRHRAFQAMPNVYYGTAGIPYILDALNKLNSHDKNYFDTKTKLIAELGFIKDSGRSIIPEQLRKIYGHVADTSLFQNEVVKSLARLKTRASYKVLKEIFLQDPPVFENNYEYKNMFDNLEDSLSLTRELFPELLRLSTLDDYKDRVLDLLVMLVDSGFVNQKTYESYFPGIYIDARVLLKKQKSRDEKQLRSERKKDEDDNDPIRLYDVGNKTTNLQNYAILLIPYFHNDKNVQHFFEGLLDSRDDMVKLNTAILMIRNQIPVADSLLLSLASNDKYRSVLYRKLDKLNKLSLFPVQYMSQNAMAKSILQKQSDYNKLDSVSFLSREKASIKGKTGFIYFYKYRLKKTDQWKIGISGLQPLQEQEVSTDDQVSAMTDVRLKENEPLDEQLHKQLRKILFGFHKSGKKYFSDDNGYSKFKSISDFED